MHQPRAHKTLSLVRVVVIFAEAPVLDEVVDRTSRKSNLLDDFF
jgi:hypothetical protein